MTTPEPQIQNDWLTVTVSPDGRPILTDRTTGITWAPFGEAERAATPCASLRLESGGSRTSGGRLIEADLAQDARVAVEPVDDQTLRVVYSQLSFGAISYAVTVTISLHLPADAAALDITVEHLSLPRSLRLVSLTYPCHQIALRTTYDDGYLVVPTKQGVIVPTRFETGFMRYQHNTWAKIADQDHTLAFETGSLNMPWYGAVRRENDRQSALLVHVQTPADASLRVVSNAVLPTPQRARLDEPTSAGERVSTLTPIWRGSQGALGYARRLRVELIPGGSYVTLAQRYRQIAMESGRHRSLRDKIHENPKVQRIVGAPDVKLYIYTHRLEEPFYRAGSEPVLSGYTRVNTTFDQVADIVSELYDELDVRRALVLLGGWIRAGYDREHPDVWPPAEPAGGVEGLRRASQAAEARDLLLALHDNYQDMYPQAPSFDADRVMRTPEGDLKHGHVWDGGPCELICSRVAHELARPNVERVLAETETSGYYLDTTTAARLYECYDPRHPLTRTDDREQKLALLRWLADQGLVVGGEAGTDWAVPVCSFFEGIPGTSKGFFDGVTGPSFGIWAPLFALVYHDAVVCYWQHGQPFGREDHDNHVLHDLVSGNPSSWVLEAAQWDDLKPLIKQAADLLGALHRRTAHQAMVDHRFLSEDYAVHEARFADGLRIVVNFGIISVDVDGHTIAPKGFWVQDPDGPDIEGRVRRRLELTAGDVGG